LQNSFSLKIQEANSNFQLEISNNSQNSNSRIDSLQEQLEELKSSSDKLATMATNFESLQSELSSLSNDSKETVAKATQEMKVIMLNSRFSLLIRRK
jgi:methyl-accepting chemotaxis protein